MLNLVLLCILRLCASDFPFPLQIEIYHLPDLTTISFHVNNTMC